MSRRFLGIGIRRGIRTGAVSGGAPPEYFYGISGFTASNYYSAALTDYGDDTGFLLCILFTMRAVPSSLQVVASNLGTGGHEINFNSAALRGFMRSGAPATVQTPTRNYTSSDVDKTHLVVLQRDGGTARMWSHRTQVGSGTSITGYTASSEALNIGRRPGGTGPASDIEIHGAQAYVGAADQEAIGALYDHVKANAAFPASVGSAAAVHGWPVPQGAPETIEDSVGSDDLARSGAPTGTSIAKSSIVWGW